MTIQPYDVAQFLRQHKQDDMANLVLCAETTLNKQRLEIPQLKQAIQDANATIREQAAEIERLQAVKTAVRHLGEVVYHIVDDMSADDTLSISSSRGESERKMNERAIQAILSLRSAYAELANQLDDLISINPHYVQVTEQGMAELAKTHEVRIFDNRANYSGDMEIDPWQAETLIDGIQFLAVGTTEEFLAVGLAVPALKAGAK